MNGDSKCTEDCHSSVWRLGQEQITGCPYKKITHADWEYINLYYFYKRQEYPNPGEWFRQPAKYFAAMRHIESTIEKSDEEERIKHARKRTFGQSESAGRGHR